jgi:Carboxypeptidase regulatory-like domain
VKAAHPDYPDTVLGPLDSKVVGGTIIRVAEKQRSTQHDFALVRAGSVSGMVTEAGGRPLGGATIRLISLPPANAFTAFNLASKTDERGRYTVARVPEGRFHVHASWIDQETSGTALFANPATVYFPGTRTVAEAVAVDVGPATDVRNIDMAMIGDPLLRLSGHVIRGSSGGPIEGELRMRGGVVRTFKIAADGAFDLRLRAGRYVLLARSETDGGAEAGSLAVDLDSDTTGLLLTLAQGGRISGRVVTDDGSSITDRLYVLAVLSDGTREIDLERRDRVEVSSSGAFELTGLAGDRVLRVVGLSENWTVYQVLVGKTAVSSLSLDAGSVDDVTILLKRQ